MDQLGDRRRRSCARSGRAQGAARRCVRPAGDAAARRVAHPRLRTRARAEIPPPDLRRSAPAGGARSEEHTSELQSLMRISYAVFCLKKKTIQIHKSSITLIYKTTPHFTDVQYSPHYSIRVHTLM